DRALELDPDDDDARYNRALLEKLLEQQEPPPEPSAGQQPNGEQDERGDEADAEHRSADAGESGDGSEAEAGAGGEREAGESGERQAGDSDSAPSDAAGDGDERFADAPPPEGDGEDRDGGPEPGEPDAASEPQTADASEASPVAADELERWASDQAAEQWLRRVRQDPGGLLRRKFLYQYQRLGIYQQGNDLFAEQETERW